MQDITFDLYLIDENYKKTNTLVLIPHLTHSEASMCAEKWSAIDNTHDYYLVTESSTPWTEPKPEIVVMSLEWFKNTHFKEA